MFYSVVVWKNLTLYFNQEHTQMYPYYNYLKKLFNLNHKNVWLYKSRGGGGSEV